MLDRELYVPKSWFADRVRCAEAAIPSDVEFETRPSQVVGMLQRLRAAGAPFRWFAADEEFGQNPGLRSWLEGEHIAYVMAIPQTTQFTDSVGARVAINERVAALPPGAWSRRACGIGAKGHRVYDWALPDSDDGAHQYLIRRAIDDGELAYYYCYNPRHADMGALVRVAGSRWPIEECLCATRRSAVFPVQPGGIGGRFLGLMAYPAPKG